MLRKKNTKRIHDYIVNVSFVLYFSALFNKNNHRFKTNKLLQRVLKLSSYVKIDHFWNKISQVLLLF